MSPPRYQELLNRAIPQVDTADGGGTVRVIAGEFQGIQGPARTFTPINLWDVSLKAGRRVQLRLPNAYTTALFILKGSVMLNGSETAREAELALFDRIGNHVDIEARQDSTMLVLNGEPIDEAVASYGPFVMNTKNEIVQAASDYRLGRMGHLS
jgi:redox-sensitive bicupin YhaK (pirin superfamily)